MNYLEIVHLMNTDPVARTLVEAPIPMRLGYLGLDGRPRSVPVGYIWNGRAFVFATPTTAYKVRAIAAYPHVSFTVDTNAPEAREKVAAVLGPPVTDYTPLLMMVRGTASIEIKPGVPEEHVESARRLVGDDEKLAEWARIKREHTPEMAVVTIRPTHVNVCDFITRFPPPVEINVPGHGGATAA